MFCALLTSRYQVSVYRTNGPLVLEYVISVWQTYKSVTESRTTRFDNEGQSKALV